MEILESLDKYTAAQRSVGTNFILLGIALIIFAGAIWFLAPSGQWVNGIKTGAIIAGVFIIAGGFSYRSFSKKLHRNAVEIYQQDRNHFVATEKVRMEKVVADYPKYQFFFTFSIVAALGISLFANRPYWSGISLAVIVLFVFVMIIEAFSHKSIVRHFEDISKY